MRVDDFKMRNTLLAEHDAAMIRGDQNYVLFGKVSQADREKTIGHYLGVRRQDASKPAVLKLQYQQSKTGSKILSRTQNLPAGLEYFEFKLAGDDFLTNGRILTWKLDLVEEGKTIASEQSYLWE